MSKKTGPRDQCPASPGVQEVRETTRAHHETCVIDLHAAARDCRGWNERAMGRRTVPPSIGRCECLALGQKWSRTSSRDRHRSHCSCADGWGWIRWECGACRALQPLMARFSTINASPLPPHCVPLL